MVQPEDCGEIIAFLARLPAHVCINELPVRPDDRVFEKTHAYCFHGTVTVTGFTTIGCVRASAVDALQHDFRTIVVEDAVGNRGPNAHRANLNDLGLKYTDLVSALSLGDA